MPYVIPRLRPLRGSARIAPSGRAPIIIAGLGRCGTTLLCNALRSFFPNGTQWINDISGKSFLTTHPYKTHSFGPTRLQKGCKIVYMFGDPRNIVVSAHETMINDGGIAKHYLHMHSVWDPKHPKRFITHDTLNLEQQWDSWMNAKGKFPGQILMVRYETLYQHLPDIRNFLGLPLSLPPFRSRKTQWEKHANAKELSSTYESLAKKIASAGDCFLL